jgi:hypothetical protein
MMVAMLLGTLKELQLEHFDVLDDGDDCLVIVERREEYKLQQLPHMFTQLGHKLTLEGKATKLEDVVFCQGKICIRGDGRPIFVQNPLKVLSQAFCSHRKEVVGSMAMLRAMAYANAILYRGVPILGPYFEKCMESLGAGRRAQIDEVEQQLSFQVKRLEAAPTNEISPEARMSFQVSWGIEPEEQIEFERHVQPVFGSMSGIGNPVTYSRSGVTVYQFGLD